MYIYIHPPIHNALINRNTITSHVSNYPHTPKVTPTITHGYPHTRVYMIFLRPAILKNNE